MNYEMDCGPSYSTWNVTQSMNMVDRSCPITVITKQVKCAILSTLKFGTLTSIAFECLQHNFSPPSASQVIGTCIKCCCLARTATVAITSSAIFDHNYANAFFPFRMSVMFITCYSFTLAHNLLYFMMCFLKRGLRLLRKYYTKNILFLVLFG